MFFHGTPTKRQVSKRPVSKRPKSQVYKTSGLQNKDPFQIWIRNPDLKTGPKHLLYCPKTARVL
jgi:hypothetical protein